MKIRTSSISISHSGLPWYACLARHSSPTRPNPRMRHSRLQGVSKQRDTLQVGNHAPIPQQLSAPVRETETALPTHASARLSRSVIRWRRRTSRNRMTLECDAHSVVGLPTSHQSVLVCCTRRGSGQHLGIHSGPLGWLRNHSCSPGASTSPVPDHPKEFSSREYHYSCCLAKISLDKPDRP